MSTGVTVRHVDSGARIMARAARGEANVKRMGCVHGLLAALSGDKLTQSVTGLRLSLASRWQ